MNGEEHSQPRGFLGVFFSRCNVYGRLYKNADGSAYEGRCPRCGTNFRVRIGSEGTSSRFFNAVCPRRS
ncbi:MAG TPA: hypothetical protein PKI32_09965 [Opitutales bacterium]|nr:hypothetical protein [Opitutales bacterium]